jgi:hypothetical protein
LRVIGRRPNPALADLVAEPDTNKLRSGAAGMFMRAKEPQMDGRQPVRQTINPLRRALLRASDFEWTWSLSYKFRTSLRTVFRLIATRSLAT